MFNKTLANIIKTSFIALGTHQIYNTQLVVKRYGQGVKQSQGLGHHSV